MQHPPPYLSRATVFLKQEFIQTGIFCHYYHYYYFKSGTLLIEVSYRTGKGRSKIMEVSWRLGLGFPKVNPEAKTWLQVVTWEVILESTKEGVRQIKQGGETS